MPEQAKPQPLEIQTLPVFAPLLQDSRFKGAWGGRGSGKSHFFAELGVERCLIRPGASGVCIREVQRDLKESAKLLLEDKISRHGLGRYFQIYDREIRAHGSGLIIFRGMNDYTVGIAERRDAQPGRDDGVLLLDEEIDTRCSHWKPSSWFEEGDDIRLWLV